MCVSKTAARRAGDGLLLLGILLIAAALRAPVTGLPPMLGMIRADTALSTAAAGALTTLPLLTFGILAPFSALLGREYGLERTLFGALLAILAGVALRSSGAIWALYAGTFAIGLGIAVGNVLIPSLLKRDFPKELPSMTSAYALTMGLGSALASVMAVPLASAWGWRPALAALAVFPLAAAIAWHAQLGKHSAPARGTAKPPHGGPVWRSALAWQVTFYLGLNSTIYYVAVGWLPTILADDGITTSAAGSLHGLMQLVAAGAAPVMWILMKRASLHRPLAIASGLVSAVALAGLLALPRLAPLWAALFGFGTGAGIILGLSFVGLRAVDTAQAASLSGMAQCAGYLMAAIGPVAVGALHDASGAWNAPIIVCTVLALAMAAMGSLASRPLHIGRLQAVAAAGERTTQPTPR